MKTKDKKRKGKKSKILTIAIFVFFSYMIVEFISVQIQIRSNRQVIDTLEVQIKQQELDNEELERKLTMGDDMDYIERIARDRLGWVYPGEMVFYDMAGE